MSILELCLYEYSEKLKGSSLEEYERLFNARGDKKILTTMSRTSDSHTPALKRLGAELFSGKIGTFNIAQQ